MSGKRVKVTLLIDGQEVAVDRFLPAATHWDEVSDSALMDFARELTNLGLRSLGYRDVQTENGTALSVRPSPDSPSAEVLHELALSGEHGESGYGIDGLRAVWRHGCDTGMVAP